MRSSLERQLGPKGSRDVAAALVAAETAGRHKQAAAEADRLHMVVQAGTAAYAVVAVAVAAVRTGIAAAADAHGRSLAGSRAPVSQQVGRRAVAAVADMSRTWRMRMRMRMRLRISCSVLSMSTYAEWQKGDPQRFSTGGRERGRDSHRKASFPLAISGALYISSYRCTLHDASNAAYCMRAVTDILLTFRFCTGVGRLTAFLHDD